MIKTLLMGDCCASGIFKECLKMFRMEFERTSYCILLASYYFLVLSNSMQFSTNVSKDIFEICILYRIHLPNCAELTVRNIVTM